MSKQILTTSDHPVVTIRAHGDLLVKGWEQSDVSIEGGSRRSLNVRQDEDAVTIVATEDCSVMLPTGSRLILERAGGDAHISHLTGDLVCQKIGGDLTLIEVGKIAVEHVGGNCQVRTAAGEFESHHIGGDFAGQVVHGGVLIEQVGGDFFLQSAVDSINTRAGGDVHASYTSASGSSDLSAGGDILVHLPANAGVTLKISSGANEIHLNLAGQTEILEQRSYETTVGDGQANLFLKAGGDVTVTDRPWDENILKDIEDESEEHFNIHFLDDDFDARIHEVTERAINEATRRAEKRVQAALHRIEHQAHGQHQPGSHTFSATFNSDFLKRQPVPPVPPIPPEPVTDQERLMILKMVESKQITVEEAEKLLEAIEGK